MHAFITPSLPPLRSRPALARSPRITRPLSSPRASLSNPLIVAANRGLGLQLADHLSSLNPAPALHTTYRAACPPRLSSLSTTHSLDVLHAPSVQALISDLVPDTIISCVGGSVDTADYPDLPGNRNLIDAAVAAGVKRFILVSALGAGESESALPFQVMDTMRPLLLEKSHAEVYLRKQPIPWVIVRPGPLVDDAATGSAVPTEATTCYGTVTRADLAAVIADVARSEKAVGKTLHVVDAKKVLVTSPYVRPLEFWEPLPFEPFPL